MQDLYTKNIVKMREREKWEIFHVLEDSILLKVQIVPKIDLKCNTNSINIPAGCVINNWQANSKIQMERQRVYNDLNNLFWGGSNFEGFNYLNLKLNIEL